MSLALTVAALAIAGSLVHREFSPLQPTDPRSQPPIFQENWKEALPIATRVGPAAAPIQVVELGDVECPACRSFHSILNAVMTARPHDVALAFVHLPLPQHPHAPAGASAVECASSAGRAAEMLQALFASQDSVGLKAWSSYGQEAGIRDTAQFAKCVTENPSAARIAAGKVWADSIHATGTPTVIINGWRFSHVPMQSELNAAVDALLAGKSLKHFHLAKDGKATL